MLFLPFYDSVPRKELLIIFIVSGAYSHQLLMVYNKTALIFYEITTSF